MAVHSFNPPHREHQFTHAQSSATNRTLTLGRIKMCADACIVTRLTVDRATSNLYVLVQKRTPMAAKYSDTVPIPLSFTCMTAGQASQLQKIQEFIMDLQDVTDEYERAAEAERGAAAKASVSP